MTTSQKSIAIVNGTGRQAASVIRAVQAVGWHVKAQIYEPHPLVIEELEDLDNVELFQEPLEDNQALIDGLFEGCQYAFINTFPAYDEVKVGKALADAAKRHGVQHYVYGSMPDHSIYNAQWPGLPNWACKFTVENYIREIGLPATFLYAGIYNNNFTSLPYPLFCMEFKDDDTLQWQAPFDPNTKLPWLDAEADSGPAVLQLLKEGIAKWKDRRVALVFQSLTPIEVCQAFERALNRPCRYVHNPTIEIRVPIPENYRQQLRGIEELFGKYKAQYFPNPEFQFALDERRDSGVKRNGERPKVNASSTQGGGDRASSASSHRSRRITSEARRLWPGFRRMEDYARETFPIEEEANGKTWMKDKSIST
ncbi:hypothetical protein LTR05_002314 [Lithohypha guttulata]|uniref:NmrA-like domain-containing protein n=1 Tax=Lithohypha guttulata TaxID=1690604 RepID=A0AAN7T3M1_9EURO|nr:hypothetical protein LTR05_002314 [Lithohypha guttulata]